MSRLDFLNNPRVAERYYESHLKDLLKDSVYNVPNDKINLHNDYWSLLDYGEYGCKVVYHRINPNSYKKQSAKPKSKDIADNSEDNFRFYSSLARTRSTIFDIAICNKFEYFCTFTQSKELRDRFDLHAFRKDFSQFIRDLNKKRTSKIKYLLVPEQHKDGAWHMHGLLMGLTDSDFTINKNGYLDWVSYSSKFGFFSCSKIENHIAVSKYITKYLTKEVYSNNLKNNQHSYFASQGLKRPEYIVKNSLDNCPFTDFDYENDYIKSKWIDYKNINESGVTND